MSKFNQKGLVAPLVVLIIVTVGIIATFFATQQKTILFSKAATPSSTPVGSPLLTNRVFVTSTIYNGNLGGLSGADQKCQDRASAANLGGTWKAWLSLNSFIGNTASDRLNHSSNPYVLLNGTVIANDWSDLTDGVLNSPINITEFNQTNSNLTWTNTLASGLGSSNLANCGSWTSSSQTDSTGAGQFGGVGYSSQSSKLWTENGTFRCDLTASLYCIEQPAPTPTPTPQPKDSDRDGWTDDKETFMGTNPNQACPNTPPGVVSGDNAWPPDFNNNGAVNSVDYSVLRTAFNNGVYNKRYDLNQDGVLDVNDYNVLKSYFGQFCGVISSTNNVNVTLSRQNALGGLVYGSGFTIKAGITDTSYQLVDNPSSQGQGFAETSGLVTANSQFPVRSFINTNKPNGTYTGSVTLQYNLNNQWWNGPTLNYTINLTD